MSSCCDHGSWRAGGSCCASCRLERDEDGTSAPKGAASAPGSTGAGGTGGAVTSTVTRPIKLEGSGELVILARIDQQQIERVRFFSADCELDAGGRRVYLLTGVTPAASIAWLEGLVTDENPAPAATPAPAAASAPRAANAADAARRDRDRDRSARDGAKRRRGGVTDGAIAAIAMHADAAADAALDRLVAPSRPTDVRRKATFWLASARGKHGFDVVRRLVRDETDAGVRKHAVFALTVSKEPEATNALLDAARNSPFTDVRGEALFWSAQVAGRRAVETLTEAIERDPETDVKKKAVFGLSQLPNHEGVPMLIQVARTNQNPAVRKQAMFWLGQSKDPRALDFFESVLK